MARFDSVVQGRLCGAGSVPPPGVVDFRRVGSDSVCEASGFGADLHDHAGRDRIVWGFGSKCVSGLGVRLGGARRLGSAGSVPPPGVVDFRRIGSDSVCEARGFGADLHASLQVLPSFIRDGFAFLSRLRSGSGSGRVSYRLERRSLIF